MLALELGRLVVEAVRGVVALGDDADRLEELSCVVVCIVCLKLFVLLGFIEALLALVKVLRHVVHLGKLLLRPELQVGELAAHFGLQLVMRVRCGGAAKG